MCTCKATYVLGADIRRGGGGGGGGPPPLS